MMACRSQQGKEYRATSLCVQNVRSSKRLAMVVCAAADSNINTAVVPTTLDNADCRQKEEGSTASSVSTGQGPLN